MFTPMWGIGVNRFKSNPNRNNNKHNNNNRQKNDNMVQSRS